MCVGCGLGCLGLCVRNGASPAATVAVFREQGYTWGFVKGLHPRRPHPSPLHRCAPKNFGDQTSSLTEEAESSSKKLSDPREGPDGRSKLLAGRVEGGFLDHPGRPAAQRRWPSLVSLKPSTKTSTSYSTCLMAVCIQHITVDVQSVCGRPVLLRGELSVLTYV